MKQTLWLILVLLAFSACDQKTADPRAEAIASKKALYEAALKYGDNRTAAVALNELMLLDTANLEYVDSLARNYMMTGNFAGAVTLAEKVIDAGKADTKLKELTGVSYQQVQDFKKAKVLFENLFESTQDYRYLYQVATIAYESGDKDIFQQSTQKMMSDIKANAEVAATVIEIGGPITGVGQQVPLKAAVLFLQGKFEQDYNKNYLDAVVFYERAIGAYEPFEMPRYYIKEIEKARRQGLIR